MAQLRFDHMDQARLRSNLEIPPSGSGVGRRWLFASFWRLRLLPAFCRLFRCVLRSVLALRPGLAVGGSFIGRPRRRLRIHLRARAIDSSTTADGLMGIPFFGGARGL